MVAAATLLIVVGLMASNMAASATSGSARGDHLPSNDVIGRRGNERMRRASSFVRIGKASSRIGEENYDGSDAIADRNLMLSDLQKLLATDMDVSSADNGDGEVESQYGALEGGETSKRASSFVRIGKSAAMTDDTSGEMLPLVLDKKASAFVRIGRPNSFNSRVGSPSLSDMEDFYRKRMSSFVRIGKKSIDQDSVSTHSLPCDSSSSSGGSRCLESESADGVSTTGIGSSAAAPVSKKASSFVRIGRSA